MRMLILGGTGFVGRHVAHAALAVGYEVTLANRGLTDAKAFPDCEHVRIDRTNDIDALAEVDAEIVVDTSGYTPDEVLASARAVAGRVRTYVFMSSIDAYDMSVPAIDESSPTKRLTASDSTSQRSPESYGAHKVRCEELLVKTLGAERVISVRAGLMIGPYDNTDRFTYWPVRVRHGGEILVPESRAMPVQCIDARDVARWIAGALATNLFGTFNLVGTPGALTFGDVLDACVTSPEHPPTYAWAPSEFLVEREVGAWVELPLWLPEDSNFAGLRSIANARAVANGLTLRPLRESVRDILTEFDARESHVLRAGPTAERETILLRELTPEVRRRSN